MNEVEFVCKCGKVKGWIKETTEPTVPCPVCGRTYIGVYDPNKLTIIAKEVVTSESKK